MARALADRTIKKAIAAVSGEPPADGSDLPQGHQKLFNFCLPPLNPGLYGIEAKQVINAPNGETLPIYNFDSTAPAPQPIALQNFTVIAPQFQLDPKVINSYYPPDGHLDEGRILPHIVFNDPHTPWDRPAFRAGSEISLPLPWMALITFDPEELALTAQDGAALGIPSFDAKNLPSSGAYAMSVGDYLTKITSRVNYDVILTRNKDSATWKKLTSSTDSTSIIFPKKSLVASLFPVKRLSQNILLSHVREANNVGFPDAEPQEKGLYAICISQRSGPIDNTTPKSQVVHLVSIENIFFTNINVSAPPDRIGLVSLFSFRYLCVPPKPTNFISIMKSLGDQRQMLRPPQPLITSIQSSATTQTKTELTTAANLLGERLELGYSITRWRVVTGEETIAFIRGPLTPTITPQKPSNGDDWPDSSNSGKEYQILDNDLGVMDITYSSAFQVGKLMAVSDPVFASAVFRFRSLIQNRAASNARMIVNGVAPASTVINNALKAISEVEKATRGKHTPARIVLPTSTTVAPPLRDPEVLPVFRHAVRMAIGTQTSAGEAIYSDYNLGKANNSDWEIIHKWISDKMFLAGIPAHYLITDPSHIAGLPTDYKDGDPIALTPEAFRFFYVDPAWLDCFIDGALSVANHLDPGDDFVRRNIKEVYNVYLSNTIDPAPVKPPVPRYGFFIRSLVIKAIPDLRVTVRCRKSIGPGTFTVDDTRAPLVRLTKVDDFTILALLDCLPEEIKDITLAQPPHQQRFAAPLPPAPNVPFPVKKLFTSGAPDGPWPIWPESQFPNMGGWYDPSTRCVNLLRMATDLDNGLKFSNPPQAFAGNIDPAIFALELNDENYQLTLQPPLFSAPGPNPPPDRQLWVHDPVDTSGSPVAALRFVSPPPSRLPTVKPNLKPKPITAQPVSALVPSLHASASPITAATTAPPPSATTSPQYLMSIHPDYRGPAPLPFVFTFPPRKVFSSRDFLPTAPLHLPDLIFSIHRNPAAPPRDAILTSLTVILPTSQTPPTPAPSPAPSEPLLQSPYTGPGASLIHNKHLVTLLSTAPGELHIQLVPRSAALGQTIFLSDPSLLDASFKLAACAVAPTETPVVVEVHGEGMVERGVCKVTLVETYAFASGAVEQAVSVVDVLKREGGDVDLAGSPV